MSGPPPFVQRFFQELDQADDDVRRAALAAMACTYIAEGVAAGRDAIDVAAELIRGAAVLLADMQGGGAA